MHHDACTAAASPGATSAAPAQPPRLLPSVPVLADHAEFAAHIARHLPAWRRSATLPAVLLVQIDRPVLPPPLLLEALGARLRGRVRGGDLVMRLGGHGFGVVLLGAARVHVPAVQARLQASLSGTYGIDEQRLQVSLRIGAAAHPDGAVSATELVLAAKEMLTS